MKTSGWGNFPVHHAQVNAPYCVEEVIEHIRDGHAIARGNGRAYGDSAISTNNTISMKHFNRMLAFDDDTGQLVAQAGVLLADVIHTFLPKGWFPSVTPGTKLVTLGGMVAADVHGKNHHKEGSFGHYIDWLDIITSDGEIQRCSKDQHSELFYWTIGGMGLTGVVLNVAFRLKPVSTSWIKQRTLTANNIEQAIELFEQTLDATYSVAWIDCLAKGKALGRSLIMLGEHAGVDDLPAHYKDSPLDYTKKKKVTVPFHFPSFALNGLTVKLFNKLYYYNGKRQPEHTLIDWDSYFYPLDSIVGWNKIYGRKGFAQFQCVIPLKDACQGMRELLHAISAANSGSFLAVLKRFGKQESGFSFPMEGYTLALDFPISKKTLTLMSQLDEITLKYGGRFYLAKDSRMAESTFKQSESRLSEFTDYRSQHIHKDKFLSEQAKRLGL